MESSLFIKGGTQVGYYFQAKEVLRSIVENTELVPIVPGQYLICTDSGDLFYDIADSKRVHLTDIIDLETDAERTAILVPIDKTYFVKSTGHFWRYLKGAWVDLSALASGSSSIMVAVTLLANAWKDGQQTVAVTGMTKDHNGTIGLSQTVTNLQFEATKSADLSVYAQKDGELTIVAYGDTPTIDIPAVVILTP